MERRIRDASRLVSNDATNDSSAKDDVSIGSGFLSTYCYGENNL